MKRMFVMTMLITLACAVAFEGTALAQRGERSGSGRGARPPAQGRGELAPPEGPMGGPMGGFGGPMMGPHGPRGGFGPGGRPPGPPPGFRPHSFEELERAGVTQAQLAGIRDLRDESMRRMIRGEADLRIAELDLRKLLDGDKPDAAAIEAAIDRVGGMRTALWKGQVTEMLAVRGLLTPEQRAKLKQGASARDAR